MRLPIFPAVPITITASNLIIQSQIDMLKSKLKYAAFMRKAKGVMDIGNYQRVEEEVCDQSQDRTETDA